MRAHHVASMSPRVRAHPLPRIAWVAGALLVSGCYMSHTRAVGDAGMDAAAPMLDGGVSRDAGSLLADAAAPLDASFVPPDAGPPIPMSCNSPRGVDLLLVLDDSGSIRPRDPQLRDRLERMMRRLVRPLDIDRDGVEDWPRVTDLHFGTVSTSVRAPSFCESTADGRLESTPDPDLSGCQAAYPTYLAYLEGDTDPDRFAHDSVCVSFGPRDGCPIEQPLEAMAKALLPHDAPFTFIAGEPHGDTENAGFLRQDSVLAVLIVADEDDCSVVDPTVLESDGASVDYGGPRTLGCVSDDKLQPLDRYAKVLRWVRGDDRFVLGMIVGIEGDTVITDPTGEPPLGCFGPIEFPHRLYRFAQDFPTRSVVGSVCGLSQMDAVQAIANRIADAACAD